MLFLHISDIHFKKSEVGEPDDPNLALRSDLIADVKKMRAKLSRSADGILLSGDIAFAGKPEEYEYAYTWLEKKLCPAAGCKIEDVFVIPGNHDVDRTSESGPAQVGARQHLRQVPANRVNDEIRKWMRDRASAAVIFGPIESYNRFAAKFLCALKPYIDDTQDDEVKGELPAKPFAVRDVQLNDGSVLRLWGFNSVLVSDANDAEGLMLVDPAAAQIEEEDGVVHLVMCHHPFGWLKNKRPFEDRLNKVVTIQLFGHEHTRRIDEHKRYIRIRAGALQPDRDDSEWKPGYNWIDVTANQSDGKRRLSIKVWARMHEESHFIAVPDQDDNEIWENNFELPEWVAPASKQSPKRKTTKVIKEDAVVSPSEPQQKQSSPPSIPSVRSVMIKIFKLKEHEQRRVITQLKLDRAGDRDLKDYELVINAVRRSSAQGALEELDQLIDSTLAGGKK